eukprot:GHVU01088440.1.p2 GENE.GHVU01088440.1~~GHVU01088440.1.p2  ORF type:complete len:106 (-),score=4.97 GHVU01088440.1:141-458(-)
MGSTEPAPDTVCSMRTTGGKSRVCKALKQTPAYSRRMTRLAPGMSAQKRSPWKESPVLVLTQISAPRYLFKVPFMINRFINMHTDSGFCDLYSHGPQGQGGVHGG